MGFRLTSTSQWLRGSTGTCRHSGRDFRLCQTGRLPRLAHLSDNREDGAEPDIFGFGFGVGQQSPPELVEACHGLIYFARSSTSAATGCGDA